MGPFVNAHARAPQGATKRCTLEEGSALGGDDLAFHLARQHQVRHFHGPLDPSPWADHQGTWPLDRTLDDSQDFGRIVEEDRAGEVRIFRNQGFGRPWRALGHQISPISRE
jgi:hypothetical protein